MAALKQTAGPLNTSKTVSTQGVTDDTTRPLSEILLETWIEKYGGKKNEWKQGIITTNEK